MPAKIFPVFRDRDELPFSSDLGGTIQGALKASRYLIVLCSPNSAKSQWVNEEIRCFKSLGRADRILAVILDGEPGAADMPGREDEECFPEAIKFEMGPDGEFTDKRCEPIGGDLRKGGDGWERVFLKAMAGITGLGFDAFARRQLRRKRRKQLVLGALCLLAPLAGLWTWDYNRLKVDWYAHAEEQFGVPVGIRELSAEEISHRGRNLRFESRRGKLRRVLEVDAFGNQYPSKRFGMVEASMLELVYGDEGQVVEHRLFRRDGGEVLRRTYSDDLSVVEFKAPGGNAARAASGAVGSLTQRDWGSLEGEGDQGKQTEITRWELTRDEEGFVTTRRFQNIWGAPRSNAEGVFGVRFLRDEQGLVVREQTMGEDGQVAAGRGRLVAEVRQEYGEFVKPVRTSYHDASGTIVRSPGGHVEERSEFDQWGNETGKVFLGPDGELIRRPGGIARVEAGYGERVKYDREGRKVEERYVGVEEEPMEDSRGRHLIRWKHDEFGEVSEVAYYGADGAPTIDSTTGFHRMTRKNSPMGQVLEQTFWDTAGKRTVDQLGRSKTVWKFDGAGRLTFHAFYGVGDEPVEVEGVARKEGDYDPVTGELLEVRTFDAAGKEL